jgi:PAS domain S-box-containing protein
MDTMEPLDILVIEDDEDTRINLRDLLEMHGHRVELAGTAASALGRDDLERFAAVILDRRLPDGEADELLPQLRAKAPGADVIVVTGYSDLQGAIAALRQGAADYILKPLNPELLRASLARSIGRRRLAQAKERSDAVFRHLVEAAECLIVIFRADRSIVYFSPYAERLTGYPARDVHGRNFCDLLIPEQYREASAREFSLALDGEPVEGWEVPIEGRDGLRRWVVWNARRLSDYESAPAVLAVGQDITEFKRAQRRALQTERLAAIGEVVAGLAHESRNAMQRSQACLEMLALADRGRPESLDLIARIQNAQDHLHRLYEDVRLYAAPIVLERRPCDLRAIWRQAWTDLETARRSKGATLHDQAGTEELGCTADPFRIGQVFHNLLDNALAAGQAPVEVRVFGAAAVLDGRPALQVTVSDSGPGMDAEQRRRVFDPFYTTKAKGTGLGMPIAKRIIEAHGGLIEVGEAGPPGAVFLITLPRGNP